MNDDSDPYQWCVSMKDYIHICFATAGKCLDRYKTHVQRLLYLEPTINHRRKKNIEHT